MTCTVGSGCEQGFAVLTFTTLHYTLQPFTTKRGRKSNNSDEKIGTYDM